MLVDQVSEALHALSHGYHNISDIAYELAVPPPRQLMAQSLPIYHQAHSPAVVVNQTLVRQLVDSGWMCVVNQTLVRQLVDSGWMCGQPDFGKAVSGLAGCVWSTRLW